jgi:surface antigen
MKHFLIPSALFILSCFISNPVYSYEFNFLNDSPAAYFTEQDWTLYRNAAKNALNNAKDGSKVTWTNPSSGNGGYALPLKTYRQDGVTCRKLTMYSYAKQRKDSATYDVCKYSTGWKIPGDTP